MPNIGYESAGFEAALAGLNGGGVLTCTWAQLVWAAVTVGKAFGDEAAFGLFSTFERIHRGSMLYAYLVEAPTGAIMKADTYLGADPSEKGNISYSLGMTLAKLYSELLLSTPRLLHYATYAGGQPVFFATPFSSQIPMVQSGFEKFVKVQEQSGRESPFQRRVFMRVRL